MGTAVPGWTAIMIVVLFIGGVQLFCIGMIGLYLNAVHEQSKMRPNYIIASTYGFDPKS
jgi:dolichol-phosphate mannosyltransferase